MSGHSLLSPSGAKQWIACPPSIRAGEALPDSESEAAREGTLAHEIGETLLLHSLGETTDAAAEKTMSELRKHELFNETMFEHARDYADYCLEVFAEVTALHKEKTKQNPKLRTGAWVEQSFDLSLFIPEGRGTGDFTALGGACLHIVDLKYGRGIEVAAENNPQLMSYAMGAYVEHGRSTYLNKVVMHIYQPRLNNISRWEVSDKELTQWATSVLRPAAELAFEGGGEFKAGDHCTFCKVGATCATLAEHNLEIAREIFDDFDDPKVKGVKDAATLTPAQIGNILTKAPLLTSWLKKLGALTLQKAIDGQKFDGLKVVLGRGKREITDWDELVETMRDDFGIPEELLYERKLISLTGIEKMVGKSAFEALAGDLVEKKDGKPTLAPVSDKRKEFKAECAAEVDFDGDFEDEF